MLKGVRTTWLPVAETQLKLAVAKEKTFMGLLNWDVPEQVDVSRGWIKSHGT